MPSLGRRLGRRRTAKLVVALAGAAVLAVLSLGPTWVVPVDRDGGQPYHLLAVDHPDYSPPRAAQRALGVFVLCITFWVTGVIPLPATGLLALGLLALLGVVPASTAFGYFGNTATMFLLGVFLLAAATIQTGLSKRLTLFFLSRCDQSPKRLIGGVMLTSVVMSLIMPEHAVVAMLFPIVLEIAEALRLKKPGSAYARTLFLAMAWGAAVGGIGTFLGGGRAPLAVDLLRREFPDADIPTFLSWMGKTMPVVVILTGLLHLLLTYRARFEISQISSATALISQRVRQLGPMSGREKRVSLLLVGTIACWMFGPELSGYLFGRAHRVDVATISLVAAAGVFVLRVAPWPRLEEYVNWGVLVMYGGAVAIGEAMARTHAADWVATHALPRDVPGWLLLVCIATFSIALTETMSNAAVVALMVPVGFGLCHSMGIDPVTMIYMVAIPAGLAFTLPMSSPPCAIAFSSGYYRVGDVIRPGVLLNVIALLTFLLVARFYWPLVGIKL